MREVNKFQDTWWTQDSNPNSLKASPLYCVHTSSQDYSTCRNCAWLTFPFPQEVQGNSAHLFLIWWHPVISFTKELCFLMHIYLLIHFWFCIWTLKKKIWVKASWSFFKKLHSSSLTNQQAKTHILFKDNSATAKEPSLQWCCCTSTGCNKNTFCREKASHIHSHSSNSAIGRDVPLGFMCGLVSVVVRIWFRSATVCMALFCLCEAGSESS